MIHRLLLYSLLFCFLGCKSKKLTQPSSTDISIKKGTNTKLIQAEKSNFLSKVDSSELKFQTFGAKGSIDFAQNGSGRKAEISLRIKRDEIIWFYVNLSIIPVAEGYITPTDIKIKNLLSGEYTHKKFEFLEQIVGIPVNFKDLQSILVGNRLNSLLGDSSKLSVSDMGEYLLKGVKNPLKNSFSFNSTYRPLAMEVEDSTHNRKMNLLYSNFLPVNTQNIPQSIQVLAKTDKNNLEIHLDYRRVLINPEQDYPFQSPDDSK